MFQGLTKELQTPRDLLAKRQFDFARIKANPYDEYAAFDFFVTAEHLPEWVGDMPIKFKEPLLKVVSHIANGAKHFRATDPKHKSVKDVYHREGAFQPEAFQPDAFDGGGIVVEMEGDEAKQFGSEISIIRLAQMVLKFWSDRIT